MKLSRRAMFPLAAVGAAALGGEAGAAINPNGMPGLHLTLFKMQGQWQVTVPDWESMNAWWTPGMCVPTKMMPVQDYLNLLDETYSMEG